MNDGSGAQRLFYHQNTLYSVFALTDETGAIKEAYQYDAYGRQSVDTSAGTDVTWFTSDDSWTVGWNSAVGNPYTYTGQRFDAESGNSYYKNRYYASGLGRFLSRDPVEYKGGINLYQYVGDRTERMIDALGLDLTDPESMSDYYDAIARMLTACDSEHPTCLRSKIEKSWGGFSNEKTLEYNWNTAKPLVGTRGSANAYYSVWEVNVREILQEYGTLTVTVDYDCPCVRQCYTWDWKTKRDEVLNYNTYCPGTKCSKSEKLRAGQTSTDTTVTVNASTNSAGEVGPIQRIPGYKSVDIGTPPSKGTGQLGGLFAGRPPAPLPIGD